MKYLIEFVEADNLKKTQLFELIKCSEYEAKLLQYITIKFLGGEEEVVCIEALQALDGDKGYTYLEHLDCAKTLLELGWLTIQSFIPLKVMELSKLELLNSALSLSPSFLRLLEEGSGDVDLPDLKPYTDQLEYLQDQFFRVELYQKMSSIRVNVHEQSLGINRILTKLEHLEKRINERLEKTEEDLVLEKFFKSQKLEEKEEIIFLALLKEEYNSTESNFREMTTLIDLISFDEYDRIKNRSLLEDGATLLANELIDYDEILNPFGGISRSFYIVDEVLQSIIHPQKKKKVRKLKLDMLIKEQDIFQLVDPQTSLEDVVLNAKTEETLKTLIKQLDKDVMNRLVKWGIKDKKSGLAARIIFYGHPGTGKTLTAYSLSKSLKKQVLSFDCSKILSMYVGESEKNVRKIFDTYYDLAQKAKTEPVLLLNEADQFLSSRGSNASSADQMHNQMQNIFLEQIEKFDGILIATTNLLENIDIAFSRRFNYKIEFKKPNKEQRVKLWNLELPKQADFEKGFDIDKLSEYSLTGGQIALIVKNTAYDVAIRDDEIFTTKDFVDEIEKEKKGNFDSETSMGFLK